MPKKNLKHGKSQTKQRAAKPTQKRKIPQTVRELTEPSRPTVKRLFAVSGNRCAFPGCKSPLVDPGSGSIIGQICHIKGEKKGAARWEKTQSAVERHGFENLILLCGPHHKVIDDGADKYPASDLIQIKSQHETGQPNVRVLTDEQADRMIAAIPNTRISNNAVINSRNQSGGQNAHTINNYSNQHLDDEQVSVKGSLSVGGTLKLIERIGCPGLELRVICQSRRQAKISKAYLCAEGRGFIAALEAGYGASFDHNPPDGLETETLMQELIPLSPPDSAEGYVLNRDDVRRFFLPMCIPNVGVFLTLPPNQISIRVEFFDQSESTLLVGAEVQGTLKSVLEAHSDREYELKVCPPMSVRCASKTLGRIGRLVGTTNPNHVSFVDAALQQPPGTARGRKLKIGVAIVESAATDERTLGLQLFHIGDEPLDQLGVAFVAQGVADIVFIGGASGPFPPGGARAFTLPFRCVPELQRVVGVLPADQFAVVIRNHTDELQRLPGAVIQRLVQEMQKAAQAGCSS